MVIFTPLCSWVLETYTKSTITIVDVDLIETSNEKEWKLMNLPNRVNKIGKVALIVLGSSMLLWILGVALKPEFLYKPPFNLLGYCAYDVAAYEDYIYTTHNKGVYIQNTGTETTNEAKIKTQGMSNGIAIAKNMAYITGENGLLTIYNVSEPLEPELIRVLNPEIVSVKSFIKNEIAYVSASNNKTYLIDISVIDQPKVLSRIEVGNYPRPLFSHSHYLYIGLPDLGIKIFDIINPVTPIEIKTISNTKGVFDIHTIGETMLVARHSYGILALDVADPQNPKELFSFGDGGEAYGVDANEQYIFVADLQDGFEIWENSSTPKLLFVDGSCVPHALSVVGDTVYLADQDKGLIIIDLNEILK